MFGGDVFHEVKTGERIVECAVCWFNFYVEQLGKRLQFVVLGIGVEGLAEAHGAQGCDFLAKRREHGNVVRGIVCNNEYVFTSELAGVGLCEEVVERGFIHQHLGRNTMCTLCAWLNGNVWVNE